MVRPEAKPLASGEACCIRLAGESPAAVSAGAPRSRLRSWGEIPWAERSVESPWRVCVDPGEGSKVAGPMRMRESCSLVTGTPERER
jgi:hypothetical protein